MAKKIAPRGNGLDYYSGVDDLPEAEPNSKFKFPDDGTDLTFDNDGALLDFTGKEDAKPDAEPSAFDSNLAEKIDDPITLGLKLKEYVEVDLRSRAPWEQRMLNGLQIIGLEDVPDDAVAFEGAARVNHPGLAEAMVQFEARAMAELMPPEGPVKAGVYGRSTEEKEAQAVRVQDYMNYQLMDEDDEYVTETEELLMYAPYAGSAFRKVGIDPVIGRTRSRFVPATDFIVPYYAKSLKTAPRYTHRFTMPLNTFKRAVEAGYYVDADFDHLTSASLHTQKAGQRLADVSDDKEATFHEDDVDLEFAEITIDMDFDWEEHGKDLKFSLPYVITFEWETGRVVRCARCWREDDPKCEKDVWWVHYKFLPGLGFYGWGYLHVIGGLGQAASGALRLLLDGSATSSLQGGFKSKDSRIAGDVTFSPATWIDVDMTAEELSKSFYSPPYKEPSPALFKTLEILITGIQRFASTAENMVGDASNTGPVGTTLALIEQGSKVFSGIHSRMHRSQELEFKLIAKCNFRFMELEEYPYEVEGADKKILRADFDDRVDIKPVSDPNIFSNVQRIATAQAGVALVDSRPDLYTRKAQMKAHRALIRAMRLPDGTEYLPEKETHRLDPVSENVALMSGIGLEVYPEQDDQAHMALHQSFQQEILGLDPQIQQKVIPPLLAHIAAHYASSYRKRIEAAVVQRTGIPLPPFDPNNPDEVQELPPDLEVMVSQAMAQFAPPLPPAQPPPDPQAAKDAEAGRKADREDMLAKRKADREDQVKLAQLKRDGVIPDQPAGP